MSYVQKYVLCAALMISRWIRNYINSQNITKYNFWTFQFSSNGHDASLTRDVIRIHSGSEKLFYGSWNANGKKRCYRNLTPYFDVGWTVGSVIAVNLNLDKQRIKYSLNGKPVGYAMSIEVGKAYFPIICFSGNCKYFLSWRLAILVANVSSCTYLGYSGRFIRPCVGSIFILQPNQNGNDIDSGFCPGSG